MNAGFRPPAARIDGYAPLRSYACIGDGRTVALIADDGTVDWFPIPQLDSRPTLAALLDHAHGGQFELRPTSAFEVSREYIPGTNVLRTTFRTGSGEATVTDSLNVGVAGRLPWTELARRIDGTAGTVHFQWRFRPGGRFQDDTARFVFDGEAISCRLGDVLMSIVGVKGAIDGSGDIAGTITVSAGERVTTALAAATREPIHRLHPNEADDGVDRTITSWQTWSSNYDRDGRWATHVMRSALALKLLVHSPSGAIAAAATTSLPESDTGEKNWDYRFAWVRDAAYTIRALIRFGLREETHAALTWILDAVKDTAGDIRIFYDLSGRSPQSGVTVENAPGWRGIGPVVSGNRASDQLQLGVFGDLLGVVREYCRDGNRLDDGSARLVSSAADRVCELWREKDSGMWELTELRHYVSSKMGCWHALDAAIELAHRQEIQGDVARWESEKGNIERWIDDNGWSIERNAYVMWPGASDLDASILLHAATGFDIGPRMRATIEAVRAELGAGDLIYRYSGMQEEEHPFAACSFWVVGALARVGRIAEAAEILDRLVTTMPNDVGLMPEMIAESGEFWGNLPQALSHLALIDSALTVGEALNPTPGRPTDW